MSRVDNQTSGHESRMVEGKGPGTDAGGIAGVSLRDGGLIIPATVPWHQAHPPVFTTFRRWLKQSFWVFPRIQSWFKPLAWLGPNLRSAISAHWSPSYLGSSYFLFRANILIQGSSREPGDSCDDTGQHGTPARMTSVLTLLCRAKLLKLAINTQMPPAGLAP